MKQISCAIVGFGNRGEQYGKYALNNNSPLKIVSIVDPNEVRLEKAKNMFKLNDNDLFKSLDEFLAKNIKCDLVINATMDEYHKETSIKLISHKYNMLLEKPVVNNEKDLLEIVKLSKTFNTEIFVCHVLRYTPFYSTIKKFVDEGKIGKIISMELNEHVWYGHFVNAYVRGKWNNKKECGSPLLLAKCCHDTDLICWLNNKTKPSYVSSFGSRKLFVEENAPHGATKYCFECPNKESCMFNAYKFELEKDFIPEYTWLGIKKPLDSITKEEKIEYLKTHRMGECVYKTNMDLVDRQSVSIEFENGSIATLNMIGGTSKAGRHIHIVGTLGEIEGYVTEDKFILRTFDTEKIDYKDTLIDLKNLQTNEANTSITGHFGGDYYIMDTICKYLLNGTVSPSLSSINDSIYSHLICYYADEAMNKHKVMKIKNI